jgi:hypothetical protein
MRNPCLILSRSEPIASGRVWHPATDGRTYHMRLRDMRRDRERDAQAVAAGWVTLRFMYDQVVGDPAGVCADIAAARHVRLPLFASAA